MKKLAILSSLFLLALNSCSNEEIVNEEMLPGYEKQISVVAEDLVPAHGTRTSYTDNGNGYSFAWSEGDALGIFPKDGFQTIFPLGEGDGVGSNTAIFDGGKWALRPNESYAAYYPLVDKVSLDYNDIPIDYTGQVQNGNGNTDHLSAYDFMASTFTKVDAKGNVNFKLQHLGCLVQFKLTMPEEDTYSSLEIVSEGAEFVTSGTYDLSDEDHTLRNEKTSGTITIGLVNVATTADNKTLTITAMLAPVDLSASYLILTVHSESNDYVFEVPGQNLFSGKAAEHTGVEQIPYITFTASEAQTLKMSKVVDKLEYSVNRGEWQTLGTEEVPFGGDKGNLRLRGSNGIGTATDSWTHSSVVFGTDAKVACSGDIRTLADYENYQNEDTSDDLFIGLFQNCTSLTSSPKLPAMDLADECYVEMFEDCTSLTTAPELPAETLSMSCYNSMFYGCTSLTTAPKLPAMDLSVYCYSYMFYGCTSLTTAPELPATEVFYQSYYSMFYGCASLNYIKMLGTDFYDSDWTTDWVYNVAPTGTFVKRIDTTWDIVGPSGVPEDWTVKYVDENGNEVTPIPYLTFSAEAEQTLTMSKVVKTLEYSVNNGAWTTLGANTIAFGGSNGDLRLRGKSSYGTATAWNDYLQISFDVPEVYVACKGDIRTLLDYENHENVETSNARFCNLFRECTLLTSAPELPATTLADNCYSGMFNGCISLTTAPELPAEELSDDCYFAMFGGCTSLTTAPELPAKTLASNCYYAMFASCYALTTAPELPAKTLAECCYKSMFKYCFNLQYIKMMATDISATDCLDGWADNVPSTGTFVKNSAANWEESGVVPSGWTVQEVVE